MRSTFDGTSNQSSAMDTQGLPVEFSNFAPAKVRSGNLGDMVDNRRDAQRRDRRAVLRGGRRGGEYKKPWYRRRRLWLAAASLLFVGWRRVTSGLPRPAHKSGSDMAA
jgi:hypothetical protein